MLDKSPQEIRAELIRKVQEKGPRVSPPAPTPLLWQIKRLAQISVAVAALIGFVLPLLVLPLLAAFFLYALFFFVLLAALGVFLYRLRQHETTDPEILTPPTPEQLTALGAILDFDVTNQYSAFGAIKPGPFRRRTMTFLLWVINLATPFLYPRGNLARVKTIHFARWVFLDDKRRVFFGSNYDGSSESYMDDFVNKVAFGLNLTFSHGVSYPKTSFLIFGGASREQEFKNTQRRHSLPTEVWYKAYPGLTLMDISRNARVRKGLEEQKPMSDGEIRQWLSEI